MRRATVTALWSFHGLDISIHALLAESDNQRPACAQGGCISIHALLAESDSATGSRWWRYRDFYPRSPCGERPRAVGAYVLYICISIHALLAESDAFWAVEVAYEIEFLSTLSLRRATLGNPCAGCPAEFLSTLSLRRATKV